MVLGAFYLIENTKLVTQVCARFRYIINDLESPGSTKECWAVLFTNPADNLFSTQLKLNAEYENDYNFIEKLSACNKALTLVPLSLQNEGRLNSILIRIHLSNSTFNPSKYGLYPSHTWNNYYTYSPLVVPSKKEILWRTGVEQLKGEDNLEVKTFRINYTNIHSTKAGNAIVSNFKTVLNSAKKFNKPWST